MNRVTLTQDAPLVIDRVQPFDGKRPYIATGGLDDDGAMMPEQVDYMTRPSRADLQPAVGDVCFARMQGTRKVLVVDETHADHIFSTGFAVLRPDKRRVDSRYLYHYIKSDGFQRLKDSLCTGATQRAITNDKLLQIERPDPPLAEQKRIAAILDKADGIRRRRQEAARLADTLGSSLFLDRYQPCFREASKHRLVPLEECCERITDGVHITPTYINDGVPFLRITDIKNGSVNWSSVRQIPRVEYEEITKRTRPGRGDVLYSKNGTIGIPIEVTWDHDFAHFVSLARLSPKRDVLDPTFLCTFLGTDLALRQATSHSKTLTVTNLHLVEIRKILIPCPDLAEQRAFVRDAKRVAEACAGSAVAVSEAEDLFNALVQRAFRGEL